ncbi:MAG TPA: methyltransferase [Acidimicrobiales bacterium]|nr:methyltransferase [Acidimicrobiales bacterium]
MTRLVLEHLDGLSPFVVRETGATAVTETEAVIDVDDVRDALGWRMVVAVYESLLFDVARPRTLISPEHVARVAEHLRALPSKFGSFRVSAAGSDSEELLRWRAALADATGLVDDPDEGELLIRLRKIGDAWEVLLRLTPRPLATRAWRTERFEGGLNATIAAAIVQATNPQPTDRFLDMMCGSGTLLVERLMAGRVSQVVGYDIDPGALDKTRVHLRNAAIRGAKVELRNEDVLGAVGEFDKLVVNPPWGTSVGSHAENATLYPALLEAAARMAAPHATLCVLTHEIKIFESALADQPRWSLADEHRVFGKGHWPRLYVLLT